MIILYGILAIAGLILGTPHSKTIPLAPVFEPPTTINTPGVYQVMPAEAGGMNYFIASTGWWQAWQNHVRNIRMNPDNTGYQRAAQIAQAQYVMYLAVELVDRRPR